MYGLDSLESLELGYNGLATMDARSFQHIPRLRMLNASYNIIRDFPAEAIHTSFPNLEVSASFPRLSCFKLENVAREKKVLDLGHNQIFEIDGHQFQSAPRLRKLMVRADISYSESIMHCVCILRFLYLR